MQLQSSIQLKPDAPEEGNRDLGFGSVVAAQAKERLLNRDGTFNLERSGRGFFEHVSPYQSLLTMTWRKFFAIITGAYLAANCLFALIYLSCGPAAFSAPPGLIENQYLRCFFFSVQTLSTIGYGHVAPLSLSANMIATVEAYLGLFSLSVVTGLVFARVARPTAKILFSSRAVIAPYRGITAFEFRIANARTAELLDVEVKVILSRLEEEDRGLVRRFHLLNLERKKVSFFPLTWTVVHPIDESSPIRDWSEQRLRDSRAEFLIMLSGIDEIFSSPVYARSSYTADEIIWGARFESAFESQDPGQPLRVDISRLDLLQPAELP